MAILCLFTASYNSDPWFNTRCNELLTCTHSSIVLKQTWHAIDFLNYSSPPSPHVDLETKQANDLIVCWIIWGTVPKRTPTHIMILLVCLEDLDWNLCCTSTRIRQISNQSRMSQVNMWQLVWPFLQNWSLKNPCQDLNDYERLERFIQILATNISRLEILTRIVTIWANNEHYLE